MEMHTNQLKITLILYKKWILPVEETTSGGRCGFFLAAFSRPASACPSDRVSRGVFCLWKGVNEYESEIRLPRLWDLFGL
ncbi:MAG: hypothetical protein EP146_03445 [Oscillibacter sp.]|nr:hypothetical protein [Oscillibacter sp.]